jgi:hypothetical protein
MFGIFSQRRQASNTDPPGSFRGGRLLLLGIAAIALALALESFLRWQDYHPASYVGVRPRLMPPPPFAFSVLRATLLWAAASAVLAIITLGLAFTAEAKRLPGQRRAGAVVFACLALCCLFTLRAPLAAIWDAAFG